MVSIRLKRSFYIALILLWVGISVAETVLFR